MEDILSDRFAPKKRFATQSLAENDDADPETVFQPRMFSISLRFFAMHKPSPFLLFQKCVALS